MKNKKILVAITGSIAAYKSCEIIRLLCKEGAKVQVMMTKSAQKFIGKTTFASLTNNEVITDLFTNAPKAGLEHIELAIDLDAIVVIPATENILCKVASGVADEVVSTTLSVCEQPTLFIPAMNFRMWQNPATVKAVQSLRERKKIILDPVEGQLASLHTGEGRLPNSYTIMNSIRNLFNYPLPLKGKRVLITAGPTREPIDPVRFISNRSSGKMGFALARYARDLGASVILISGPVALSKIPEIKTIQVESAIEMKDAVVRNSVKANFIFMAAAVSDYTLPIPSKLKLKRSVNTLSLNLVLAPDILKSIKDITDALIIAFALETHNGKENAIKKLKQKAADFIVLNYANKKGAGFDSNTNEVTIFSKKGTSIKLERDRKDRIAKGIIDYILKT